MEGPLSGDGRESFIPTDDLDFRGAPQGLDELLRFGRSGAVGAIHIPWHSNNDGLRPAFGGQSEDAFFHIACFDCNGFEWVSEHSKVVAHRYADTGFTEINAKGFFHL